jgi:5'(3')-deoxyribonucleotidase
MDNVIVDFLSGLDKVDDATKQAFEGHLDDIPGIFGLMEPMPGAIEALHRIAEHYDCYILSTAPWANPSAWVDKVQWVTTYLDDLFNKRLIISHHKELLNGDYLVDDRPKNGASEFRGKWIQFGSQEFPDWTAVEDYLCKSYHQSVTTQQ